MSLENKVIQKLKNLPLSKQSEVLNFIEFIAPKNSTQKTRKLLKDIGAGLKIELTDQDISEAKQDMWQSFNRNMN